MAQTRDESAPSRIELVVLACLSQSKSPSDADLGDALRQLALPTSSADTARARAVELVTALARRGWVNGANDGNAAQRKLTDEGKRALRKEFKLARAPTWPQIRDRHLLALALGLAPGSDVAKAACTEGAVTAAILSERFGVRGARNPIAVCDALIAEKLGMPLGKLTLDRIRAHVLSRGVDSHGKGAPSPDAKTYAPKLAAWIAATAVAADGPPRKKMAYAVTRRWITGEASPLGVRLDTAASTSAPASTAASTVVAAPKPVAAPTLIAAAPTTTPPIVATPVAVPTPVTPKPTTAPTGASTTAGAPTAGASATDLLEVVRSTIPRIGNDGRFGEKVYVSAIWRTMNRDRKTGNMSFDHFKRWLVGANRDGRLVLARADLVGAMDAKQVTESEINDRGATFHFVLDQRNGTSRTQRENHAV